MIMRLGWICRVSISALFGPYISLPGLISRIISDIAACHVECWSYVARQSSKRLSKRSIVLYTYCSWTWPGLDSYLYENE
jgi:hypothetical protein